MISNRVVVIAVAFTVFATLYSLSELNHISGQDQQQQQQEQHLQFEQERSVVATTSSPPPPRKPLVIAKTSEVIIDVRASSHLASPGSSTAKQCYSYPNTELWGDVLTWGNSNKVASADACCEKCKSYKPAHSEDVDCNVWVYCGDQTNCHGAYQECWLKHLSHPEAARPAKEGPNVPWTSGTINVNINTKTSTTEKTELRKYHVVTSAQGSAVHWQIRIHYYWYKKQKYLCEQQGPCEMGGFTRLLHSGFADDLMDEIPTMVVDPLPKEMVENNWYVVLNRPYAFAQWVKKAKIPEKYVLMAEPDHVMIRPLPNFMTSEAPASFPFFYIEPAKPEYQKVTMKFTGQISKKELDEIAPIGNSPTFMTLEDMKTVMPLWMNTSIAIFKDPDASKAWGWVQEMYGFCIALWLGGIKHVDLYIHMMSQPPWDKEMQWGVGKPFYIIHYTYGMDYTLEGEFTPGKIGAWRYDKRSYAMRPMPRNLSEPPKGMHNDLVRTLISSFNEATAAIPCWDQYVETGKVVTDCGDKPGGFLALEAEHAKTRR